MPAVILSQVGSTKLTVLYFKDAKTPHLKKGHVVKFGGTGGFIATVQSQPRSTSGGYLYDFQSNSGDLFVFATHTQAVGSKTCFQVGLLLVKNLFVDMENLSSLICSLTT